MDGARIDFPVSTRGALSLMRFMCLIGPLLLLGACGGGGGSSPPPPDTTPPQTTITSGPAALSNTNVATLVFVSSESGSTFEGSLDGAAYTAVTSPVVLNNLADGLHNYSVKARDIADNVDATPAVASWTVDTVPPTTTLSTNVAPLTTSTGGDFTVTSDDTSAKFQSSLDGAAYSDTTVPIQLTGLSDGTHTLHVRAVDPTGNADPTPPSFTWTVDTTPPDTLLSNTPAPFTQSSTANITIISNDAAATLEASVDGGAFTSVTSPLQLSGLAEGLHTVSARATDAVGNVDATPATYSWRVDNTPPTAKILFPAGVSYTDASLIHVRGIAQDASGIASVTVNGVAAAPVTTGGTLNSWMAELPVSTGNNNYVVAVTDAAGNTASNADSATLTNKGSVIASLSAMTYDTTGDRILVADVSTKTIYAINTTSGLVSVVSDSQHGTGSTFQNMDDMVVDSANNRVLVIDWVQDALFAVDLTSGNRTIISSGSSSSDPTTINGSLGIALDSAHSQAYITTSVGLTVVAVDLSTGVRTLVTGSTRGAGTEFSRPVGIAYDGVTNPSAPRLLVADQYLNEIFAVDIATGNRSIFSSSSVGLGITPDWPTKVKIDTATHRLFVIEPLPNGPTRNDLLAIDLNSGDRTRLTNVTPDDSLIALAFDEVHSRVYLAKPTGNEIQQFDLNTLQQTLVATSDIGYGSTIGAGRVAIEQPVSSVPSSLVVADIGHAAIARVDLATGNRTVISDVNVGSGFTFNFPFDVALDTRSSASPNQAFVLDLGSGGSGQNPFVASVNLDDGTRSLVAYINSGSSICINPFNFALDAANNQLLILCNGGQTVVSMDLATKSSTIVSGSSKGTGSDIFIPMSIIVDSVSTTKPPRIFVSDAASNSIVEVDPTNGNRSLFQTISAGGGYPKPASYLEFDASNQRILVADGLQDSLLAIDLSSGSSQVISGTDSVSGASIGLGPRLISYSAGFDTSLSTSITYIHSNSVDAVFAIDMISGDRAIISR